MPLCNVSDLKAWLAPGARLLGLDVGTKTIGMALSDTTRLVATPFDTIRRSRFREDVQRLVAETTRHGVGGLVVGLPLALDGGESSRSQGVRHFARNVLAQLDLPLVLWDERLSTAAVEREMIAADMTRARRAQIIDRVAAAYILQGLLDRLRWPDPPG